jgi:hypothetical protein
MPIRVTCPAGHALYVDELRPGEAVRCPQCEAADEALSAVAKTWPSPPPPRPGNPLGNPPRPTVPVSAPRPAVPVSVPRPKRRAPALPANVEGPAAGKISAVRLLAAGLALAVGLSLAPLAWLGQWDPAAAPDWARAIVLLATLQAAYIAWMLTVPDWAGARVLMLVFAAGASLYGAALAAALTTPLDHPMLLGLGAVRREAAGWCGLMLAVMSLAAWLSGRLSARWRQEQFLPSPFGRGAGGEGI